MEKQEVIFMLVTIQVGGIYGYCHHCYDFVIV